jgi:tRNA-splicing ligase RtcB
MADHHKGYAVPIGGVVAYTDQISPSGVGYDIGCGNKAVLTDIPATEVRANIDKIMDDIWNRISFGVGQKNNVRVDHALFDDPAWTLPAVAPHKKVAQEQLGTVGSGNHYVDLLEDEQGRTWIGVHFGSRGLGHKTATYFLKAGGAKDGMDVEPLVLPVDSNLGADYLACMKLAGQYAYAGRDWVCDEVARLLGANILDEVHNHHNYAWLEQHGDQSLWVVRKGATPAFPGQRGFVGGSMGDDAVILQGASVESGATPEVQAAAMYSTVHGAGRVMGRRVAKGTWKKGRQVQRVRISPEMRPRGLGRKGWCCVVEGSTKRPRRTVGSRTCSRHRGTRWRSCTRSAPSWCAWLLGTRPTPTVTEPRGRSAPSAWEDAEGGPDSSGPPS